MWSSGGSEWNVEQEVELLREAVKHLASVGFRRADLGIVLGSGLKDFARWLSDPIVVPFHRMQQYPHVRVPGQGGDILQGSFEGTLVHCLSGRVHLYEGYSPWEVVRAVRSLAMLGTRTFLLTNAAGGIREDLVPGSLMLIVDHLNLTSQSALIGPHHEILGPRFPAMSEVYCRTAGKVLHAANDGEELKEGIYAQCPGPSYETPAEVRMIRSLGADAVGMSTVPEAVALHAMGCRVVALSLITNRAAGMAKRPPSHGEVIAEGKSAETRIRALLARAVPELACLNARSGRRSERG
ncbi:MAG: purine-nucleoside phosphorylase [Planctomycetota bacterium]